MPAKKANHAEHSIPANSIPVRIYGGFLVVAEGQIGPNWRHQNFILDTGTSPSILNARVARQVGTPLAPARVAAIGVETEMQAARIPRIELGALQVDSAEFLVADLSAVERTWKIPIAGILGLDILGRTSFRLDYEKQMLEFGQVSTAGFPVDFSGQNHLPIAKIKVDGKALRLLVDTGADRLVVFGSNGAMQAAASGETLPGNSMMGSVGVRELPAVEVEWKGIHFRQAAVVVPDRQEPWFDGLLSVSSLGIRSLALDAETQTVYLSK